MNEGTLTEMNVDYLSQKPGVQLIKAGTYQKKELNEQLGIPNLKSQIIDVPITDKMMVFNRIFFYAAFRGFWVYLYLSWSKGRS